MKITNAAIQIANPHWAHDNIEACPYGLKRKVFTKLVRWIGDRPILCLQGLRRTGKSILLLQLSDLFVEQHHLSPQQYLKFSFDTEDIFELYPASELEELLKYYFERVLNSHPAEVNIPILIVLDELQNVRGWERVVKQYYDLNANFKFLVSGSSALNLSDSSESLAGRILEFRITPLDFEEFQTFIGLPSKAYPNTISELLTIPPQVITQELEELFEAFLLIGGFPETAIFFKNGKTIQEIQFYLMKSIIDKILGRDLRKYFGLKSIDADTKLFRLLCFETGNTINVAALAKDVGLTEDTLRKHLRVFEKTYLISWLTLFDTKLRRQLKTHPKLYVASPCLALAMLSEEQLPKGSLTGHLVEAYIHERLKQLTSELYFARDESNHEIDFFCPKQKLLIESKYTKFQSSKSTRHLVSSAQRYDLTPLLISQNDWGDSELRAIPACFV